MLFRDKIQEAFDNTDDDGRTDMPHNFFLIIDIQIYVILKCRMCGEQLSSSWEAEKKKHDMWSVENQPSCKL